MRGSDNAWFLLYFFRGVENIRGQWGEGVIECLWTKRALDFIIRFLEYGILTSTDRALYDCGMKAYEEVLKPYHGFPVSTVVTLAFNFAPHRETLLLSVTNRMACQIPRLHALLSCFVFFV